MIGIFNFNSLAFGFWSVILQPLYLQSCLAILFRLIRIHQQKKYKKEKAKNCAYFVNMLNLLEGGLLSCNNFRIFNIAFTAIIYIYLDFLIIEFFKLYFWSWLAITLMTIFFQKKWFSSGQRVYLRFFLLKHDFLHSILGYFELFWNILNVCQDSKRDLSRERRKSCTSKFCSV